MTVEGFDVQGFARDINALVILASLRAGPKHGYQIALDVETDSNGLFRFQHGTLYPILHRLEAEGLIAGSWSKDGGRRRKVYALTQRGEGHILGGTDRVQDIASRLLSMLRGEGQVAT